MEVGVWAIETEIIDLWSTGPEQNLRFIIENSPSCLIILKMMKIMVVFSSSYTAYFVELWSDHRKLVSSTGTRAYIRTYTFAQMQEQQL